jgi:hypothetical protein
MHLQFAPVRTLMRWREAGRLEEARDFWRQLEAVDDSGVVTGNLQRLEEILSTPGRR